MAQLFGEAMTLGGSLGVFDPTPLHESRLEGFSLSETVVEKPKRPLSAYNLFFKDERQRLLDSLPEPFQVNKNGRKKKKSKKSHGKIGFREMTTCISKRWKEADDYARAPYYERANKEKIRYYNAMNEYHNKMAEKESLVRHDKAAAEDHSNLDADIASLAECPGTELTTAEDLSNLDADIASLAECLGTELTTLVVKLFL